MTAKKAAKAKKTRAKKPSNPADGGFGPSEQGDDFQWLPLDAVHPWPGNPRINAKAVSKVAASIREFGWVRPLIANRYPGLGGELIVGHTARLAAIELGLKDWRQPKGTHRVGFVGGAAGAKKLTENQAMDSPIDFAELLVEMARNCGGPPGRA